jgi:hypothetical protein
MLPPVGINWQLIFPHLQQKCFMRSAPGYFFSKKMFCCKGSIRRRKVQKEIVVAGVELMPDGQMHIRLDVMAADLSQRHKSDDFNSFLMHRFFEG